MLDGLPPLVELTPAALLGVAILFLLMGKLVPKAIVDDKNREIDQWRDAYEKEREARTLADKQTAELLEVTRTTKQLIEAMFRSSETIRQSGDADVSVPET